MKSKFQIGDQVQVNSQGRTHSGVVIDLFSKTCNQFQKAIFYTVEGDTIPGHQAVVLSNCLKLIKRANGR